MDSTIFLQITQEFQALSGGDGLAIFTLAILEGILSEDNSLALDYIPQEVIAYLRQTGALAVHEINT